MTCWDMHKRKLI